MRVVITEKPSVARDLAKVLGVRGKSRGYLEGDGIRITWCFGHMAELVDPASYDPAWRRWDADMLPMLPEAFDIRVREGAKEQFGVMKRLLKHKDTTEVVNACDAGREGELIFRYVVQLAKCRAPVRRLWVSSLTDQAIRKAWSQLQDGALYDSLADAARCRAEADWLVGLNATRAMTCLARKGGGGQLLSVGRVQTPTLAMIVRRDDEIASFVSEDYWQVQARFAAGASGEAEADAPRFEATWFQPGGVDGDARDQGSDDAAEKGSDGPSAATRLPSAEAAEAVAQATKGHVGVVTEAEFTRKVERPPFLYDLTSLQRRANQRYGFSADRTLQVAQALYEQHKLLTYPRTDARYLTPDQVPGLPAVVEAVGKVGPYADFAAGILEAGPIQPGRRVVDASEVGDHHAIIPTTTVATSRRLNGDEKRIYDMVARRFLAALSPNALFDTAKLVVAVDPVDPSSLPAGVRAPLTWRARGRIRIEAGWQAVDPPRKKKEVLLPKLAEGDAASAEETTVKPGQTRPPSPHNDASILKGMETAGRQLDDAALKRAMRQSGLGTPATRAAILNTLLKREFIVRQGKHVRATDRGRALVVAVPVEELKSAELTGRWEARLARMAEGKERRDAFMADVKVRTGEVVAAILAAEPPPPEVIVDDREPVGTCPICETPVREGKGAFSCEKGRACTFVIFKTFAKRKISKRSVMQLLKDGKTPVLKNFKSKKGKTFEAALKLDETGRMTFDFPERTPRRPAAGPPPPTPGDAQTASDPVGMSCPTCAEGRALRGRAAWGCSRWRTGCGWRRPFPR